MEVWRQTDRQMPMHCRHSPSGRDGRRTRRRQTGSRDWRPKGAGVNKGSPWRVQAEGLLWCFRSARAIGVACRRGGGARGGEGRRPRPGVGGRARGARSTPGERRAAGERRAGLVRPALPAARPPGPQAPRMRAPPPRARPAPAPRSPPPAGAPGSQRVPHGSGLRRGARAGEAALRGENPERFPGGRENLEAENCTVTLPACCAPHPTPPAVRGLRQGRAGERCLGAQ